MSVDVTKPERYMLLYENGECICKEIKRIDQQKGSMYYIVEFIDLNGDLRQIVNVSSGFRSDVVYYLREKTEEELSKEANEYLDETLGTFNDKLNGDKPCDDLESSLKEDLQRVHEALKDSLLRVESQAFAIFVKENKNPDLATDYYNFRKL